MKPIPNCPGFFVDELGNVYNAEGKEKKQNVNSAGYMRFEYCKMSGGTREHKQVLVHRAVLLAFTGERPGKEVNHINGNKKDNRLCNLEWCTRSENMLHAYRIGAYDRYYSERRRLHDI